MRSALGHWIYMRQSKQTMHKNVQTSFDCLDLSRSEGYRRRLLRLFAFVLLGLKRWVRQCTCSDWKIKVKVHVDFLAEGWGLSYIGFIRQTTHAETSEMKALLETRVTILIATLMFGPFDIKHMLPVTIHHAGNASIAAFKSKYLDQPETQLFEFQVLYGVTSVYAVENVQRFLILARPQNQGDDPWFQDYLCSLGCRSKEALNYISLCPVLIRSRSSTNHDKRTALTRFNFFQHIPEPWTLSNTYSKQKKQRYAGFPEFGAQFEDLNTGREGQH